MTDPVAELELVQQALQTNGMLFVAGKGGVIVLPVEDGFRLVNLGKNGRPLNLTDKHIALYSKLFPSLKELLVVNADSRRRAESLDLRLRTMASEYAESLDDGRPIPKVGTVDAAKPGEIPRSYVLIDDTGTGRLTVSIFASELAVPTAAGGVRPDEALFQFEVEKSDPTGKKKVFDLAGVKSGTVSLKDALTGVEASNIRIIYFDDNNPITGKTRVKHISKSLRTLAGWGEFVTADFAIKPVGNIYLHAEDHYGFVNVESVRGKPAVRRFGPEEFANESGSARRFYLAAILEPVVDTTGKRTYRTATGSLMRRVMSGVAAKDRARIRQEGSVAINRLAKALAAL